MVLIERTPLVVAVDSLPSSQVQQPETLEPIEPYLSSISKAIRELASKPTSVTASNHVKDIVSHFIEKFGHEEPYSDDPRVLKIWILYADLLRDFDKVYMILEEKGIFQEHALLYEAYATHLLLRGLLVEADNVLRTGISRKARPLDLLETNHELFMKWLADIAEKDSYLHAPNLEPTKLDPWSAATLADLMKVIDPQMKISNGFHRSHKAYSGKTLLSSLQNSRNKVIELGNFKYQIKGCPGAGGFAKVYKAYVDSNPEDVVALKIQAPAFPWEFYMYRQLDKRLSGPERLRYGYAHRIHVYSDVSVLVCDYLSFGTLQDAINVHLVTNRHMDEVLCIYYTIEMLQMLEILHRARIIHGDFKPDNLLVCYFSEDLIVDSFRHHSRSSRRPGICLVDWGKGIDLNLFPAGTEFEGDCRTSGFRCIEMQEKRTWRFQVDTYGLCGIVHMMLHGSYMTVEKKVNADGSCEYQPFAHFKRYWQVHLWRRLFSALLNASSASDVDTLSNLRKSFEEYLCSDEKHIKELNRLLSAQKASLCKG